MHARAKWVKTALFLFMAAVTLLAAEQPLYASPVLKENSRGSDVVILQQKLTALNYPISNINGVFGSETKRAVLLFQRDQRLKITGVVDARTWRELNRAKPKQTKKKEPPRDSETVPLISAKSSIPAIIATAKTYMGVPYKFGGTTPKGFDCSGYVQYVFAKHRVNLPRTAEEQFKIGKTVNKKNLEIGDLVFFSTYEKGASHCGIYTGAGKFIHVSSSKGVRMDELKDAYWQPKYLGAKRLVK